MKTVKDTIDNAEALLKELLDFQDVAKGLRKECSLFKDANNGRKPARFVAETSTAMQKLLVREFAFAYPAISKLIENGKDASDGSFARLHDACFQFNEAQQTLFKRHCVLPDDASRSEVSSKLDKTIGDISIFIIVQFQLYNTGSDEVTLAVDKLCSAQGITAEVLYGLLVQDMRDAGQQWYAYEVCSPLYDDMCRFDITIVEQCDAVQFPLTDELAEKLVSGEVDIPYLQGLIQDMERNSPEQSIDETPFDMLSSMELHNGG